MVFSSVLFIFRFLPIALLIYFLTPFKYKNLILFVLSLFFYSFGEPRYFILMICSILVDYVAGRVIDGTDKQKLKNLGLFFSIFFNLGILFFFKYFDFGIEIINSIFSLNIRNLNLILPLGISFYTFQTMTYTIDIYMGKFSAEKNIINFGAYVALFPQLIAGPIVKYSDIKNELHKRNINSDSLTEGIKLFILGLSKKVLVANSIGILWNEIQTVGFSGMGFGIAILGSIAFTMQIYFDFSGYSMMARGLGRMFGFAFPTNFNYPFVSRSVSEFWRRWHMTLGNFFKEYLYIPLGGNRVNKKRLLFNLFVVWSLTGLWHGAEYNFIFWGIYFFVFISIEKFFITDYLKKHKVISHIYLLIIVFMSFIIFAITDVSSLRIYFREFLNFEYNSMFLYYLRNYFVLLIIGIFFSLPISDKLFNEYLFKYELIQTICLLSLFIISIAYIVDSSYNPFLYFRF